MVKKPATRTVVNAVAAAAVAWSDRSYAPRRLARDAASARTGYSHPVVDAAFDRLFVPLTAEAIEATIAEELGSVEVLDCFVERSGRRRVRALPIGNVCIVSSRTTIGVALVPAIFALCAGCSVLVKDREDHLIAAFLRTLLEVEPDLESRARATTWKGADDAVDLPSFDAVVAFGSDGTLSALAQRLPLTTRFIPHAAKTSVGYIGAESLVDGRMARTLARRAANDALLYDGEGCLSLRVLFAERGGRVALADLGRFLRDAFVDAARVFPSALSPADAARVAMMRDAALVRTSEATVFSDAHASYLVLADPPDDDPPSFLPRTLRLLSVSGTAEAAAYLQRHGIAIEALAVSGNRDDYADLAATLGAARIAPFGSLQSPPTSNAHGGRPRIAEFVRWLADET
jgi:hypothetical protein